MFFITALIPILVGALYYSPMLAGNAWMKENNFSEEDLKGGNMVKILGLAYLCSFFISFMMSGFVIHQNGVAQTMMPAILESGSPAQAEFNNLMATYGDNYRTFGHGVIHGLMVAILFVFPVIATNSLFERKTWKYNLIHLGYWAISLALVGGVLCSTLEWAPLS